MNVRGRSRSNAVCGSFRIFWTSFNGNFDQEQEFMLQKPFRNFHLKEFLNL